MIDAGTAYKREGWRINSAELVNASLSDIAALEEAIARGIPGATLWRTDDLIGQQIVLTLVPDVPCITEVGRDTATPWDGDR